MTRRLPTAERRAQIVQSTLSLLENSPVPEVTTRKIAEHVGISQPALFRHFESREALFAAVVAHSREVLRTGAEQVMAQASDWATTATGLGDVLVAHVQVHPGLARLLVHDLSNRGQSPAHRPLAGLSGMQASLISGLVRDAQRCGDVAADVDAKAAGALFVAVVQGAILTGMLGPTPNTRLPSQAIELWIAGVRGGVPTGVRVAPTPPTYLHSLDVRPLLAVGDEPFEAIQTAIDHTAAQGLLLLTAPFRPGPLIQLLQGRGYVIDACEIALKHWEIEVRAPKCPAVLDLRELEAPEPLEAILHATATEDLIVARVPQNPRLLLPRLKERGWLWQLLERADGSAIIHLRRST